jgi:hypothetical protein
MRLAHIFQLVVSKWVPVHTLTHQARANNNNTNNTNNNNIIINNDDVPPPWPSRPHAPGAAVNKPRPEVSTLDVALMITAPSARNDTDGALTFDPLTSCTPPAIWMRTSIEHVIDDAFKINVPFPSHTIVVPTTFMFHSVHCVSHVPKEQLNPCAIDIAHIDRTKSETAGHIAKG